ncbi:hypothetical protein T492DRAFT_899324 [Pavlovales sp. CCMP2436]|nr:hypothetical protein T492DRAFT_899324 [Pavlovales sp. CCMP2436]
MRVAARTAKRRAGLPARQEATTRTSSESDSDEDSELPSGSDEDSAMEEDIDESLSDATEAMAARCFGRYAAPRRAYDGPDSPRCPNGAPLPGGDYVLNDLFTTGGLGVLALLSGASGVGAWRGRAAPSSSPRVARVSRAGRVVAASPPPDAPPARDTRPHVAIVGGGWGGWGAAKALCEQGCRVTLIDVQTDPTGATPLRSASGKPVESGDYPNINALVEELGLAEDEVFTPWTNSSFYSPEGLEATAPVFSEGQYASLPSPIGQMLATFPLFERLPLADRASVAGARAASVSDAILGWG